MRFKTFLEDAARGMNWETITSLIADSCRPYLTHSGDTPLFRGVSARYLKAGITKHPEGREARDSLAEFNFAFNAGIQIAYGIPAVRRRSVFATGSSSQSAEYGEPAFFFPIAEYKYLWAPKIDDSYTREDIIFDFIAQHFKIACKAEELGDMDNGAISQQLERLFGKMAEKISAADWSKNKGGNGEDVTVETIQADFPALKKVMAVYDKLHEALDKAFKEMYKNNEGLEAAIKSGNEILFYETGGYALVPYSDVQQAMHDEGKAGTHFNRKERYQFLLNRIGV